MIETFIYKGSDALFVTITTHVCGQMEILRKEFTNFDVQRENVNNNFSKLIIRQCYLLDLANLLIKIIDFPLLLQLLISTILICVMGKYFFNNGNFQ